MEDNFCAHIATLPSLNCCAQSNLSKPKYQPINCHLKIRAQANARVEEALTRATQERTEALRRQRLAHDAEMRKAGEDILRLEREIRRHKVTRFLLIFCSYFGRGFTAFWKILGYISSFLLIISCSVSLIKKLRPRLDDRCALLAQRPCVQSRLGISSSKKTFGSYKIELYIAQNR